MHSCPPQEKLLKDFFIYVYIKVKISVYCILLLKGIKVILEEFLKTGEATVHCS